MNIIFRIDDVSKYEAFEEKVFELFVRYKVPLTIGVIPFPEVSGYYRTDSWLFHGIRIGLFEIALHGYNHKLYSKVGKYLRSEFCKRPLAEQTLLIEEGKFHLKRLFETSVHTFIPPWNSYDTNTLRALECNEIKNISARLYHGNPSIRNSLNYLPFTVDMVDLINNQNGRRLKPGTNEVAVVLFHPYDFVENYQELEMKIQRYHLHQLENLLTEVVLERRLKVQTINQFCETNKLDDEVYHSLLYRYTGIKSWFQQKKFSYRIK